VERSAFQRDLRAQGLALAACEKAVQLVYEPSSTHSPLPLPAAPSPGAA